MSVVGGGPCSRGIGIAFKKDDEISKNTRVDSNCRALTRSSTRAKKYTSYRMSCGLDLQPRKNSRWRQAKLAFSRRSKANRHHLRNSSAVCNLRLRFFRRTKTDAQTWTKKFVTESISSSINPSAISDHSHHSNKERLDSQPSTARTSNLANNISKRL